MTEREVDEKHVKRAVSSAIKHLQERYGWSMAELGRRLGIADNTVARWAKQVSTNYDLTIVIKIFKLAGLSMDEAFGFEAPVSNDVPRAEYEALLDELAGYKWMIKRLRLRDELSPLDKDAPPSEPAKEVVKRG